MTPGGAQSDHSTSMNAALDELDDSIHQRVRLGIFAMLIAMGEADFRDLKAQLALSDGNLSAHLAHLEDRGYIEVRKEFVRKRPHTSYRATEAGRAAFDRYLAALEAVIGFARPGHEGIAAGTAAKEQPWPAT